MATCVQGCRWHLERMIMRAVVQFPSRSLSPETTTPSEKHTEPPSANAVRRQLADILKSAGFLQASRMRRFLEFVVEQTLAGRAGQLCEYSIGVSVFDRGEAFEPGLDPIVRNDARRLRQKLLEYYQRPPLDGCDRVLIDIPKGSYVPTFSKYLSASAMPGERYRLSVKLIRMNDRFEVWETERELCGEELGAGLLIRLPKPNGRAS
jgi:hypothetical protein